MAIEHGGHLLPELLPAKELPLAAGEAPSKDAAEILASTCERTPRPRSFTSGARIKASSTGGDASEAALRTANSVAEWRSASVPGSRSPTSPTTTPRTCPGGQPAQQTSASLFAPASAAASIRSRTRAVAQIAATATSFAPRSSTSAPAPAAEVFEYWFDAILFAGGVPDLTDTMAEDLRFYAEAGRTCGC